VGGIRGPESILLPAFDALGMLYIPSSTLRGVARAIASKDSKFTVQQINEIFGKISPEPSLGKVIFLDAYPLPCENKQGGLTPDMANAIWRWEGTQIPVYNANPNVCLSQKHPIFRIGLRKGVGCSDTDLLQVKKWLVTGLIQGIGSRVNSGYGSLVQTSKTPVKAIKKKLILEVAFTLEGQLIHGRQSFAGWHRKRDNNGWKPPGKAEEELRPTAFRSMLRYWFRVFALGVLPAQKVCEMEMMIFGGIDPKKMACSAWKLKIILSQRKQKAMRYQKCVENSFSVILLRLPAKILERKMP
jgi:CRISPR-associated protein Cmr6